MQRMSELDEVSFLGSPKLKQGIVSFVIKNIHPTDIAFALAEQGVCVRVGHHCAMPLHTYLNHEISVRVSLGLYNDEEDIDSFIKASKKTISLFKEG